MAKGKFDDAKTYRECSEPFATPDEATAGIEAFTKEVRELRIKHKIANVLVTICDSCIEENGQEGRFYSSSFNGATMNCEAMAAWTHGQYAKEHQEHIRQLMAGKTV